MRKIAGLPDDDRRELVSDFMSCHQIAHIS